jgi:hypothetical protein
VKRTGEGESTGAVKHICMGTTQGNSLCSYFNLKLAKHPVSHFIFYVFSSTKSSWVGWDGVGWGDMRGEVTGKEIGG